MNSHLSNGYITEIRSQLFQLLQEFLLTFSLTDDQYLITFISVAYGLTEKILAKVTQIFDHFLSQFMTVNVIEESEIVNIYYSHENINVRIGIHINLKSISIFKAGHLIIHGMII